MLKNHISWIFWYLWVLTPSSGLFWPYFAVFHGFTLKCTWGSLLGHNQGWNIKFGNIHFPYCKFRILLSSGLLVAFLVLEFELKTFFNLLGPNDPKKVKKYIKMRYHCGSGLWFGLYDLHDLFWPFISLWYYMMSNKTIGDHF